MEPDASTLSLDDLLAHADWARGLAVRLVHDRDAADDLVQETWLAALRRPPARDRSPRPWLARVMRNFAYARTSARASRAWHHDERTRLDAAEVSPAQLVEHVDAQRVVAEAIVRLPEPFRATVLQRYFQGLTSAEIARRAGVPAGTVRWRLKRGLDLMRAELDDERGGRAAWSALLAPLCRYEPAPAATGAAGLLGDLGLGLTFAGRALVVLVLATGLGLGALHLSRADTATGPGRPLDVSAAPARPGVTTRSEPLELHDPVADERTAPAALPTPRDVPRAAAGAPPMAPAAAVTVRATVLHADGAPAARAALDLSHAGATRSATADADGTLELVLDDVRRARRAHVVVRAEGSACRVFAPALVPGEDLDLGVVELAPAALVEGCVLDAAGRPLAAVEVVCVPDAQLAAALAPERRPICGQTTTTDEAGAFRLPCAPLGAVRVAAFPHGAPPIVSGLLDLVPDAEQAPLELRAPRTDLRRVTGRVLGPDGSPARDTRLAWRVAGEPGSRRDARLGQDGPGSFTFDAPRDGASLELLLWSADGALVAGPLDARAGGPPLLVRLTRAARSALVIRSRTPDAPVASFDVRVYDDDWDVTLLEQRGHGGQLSVPRIGTELTVRARGFRSATLEVPGVARCELALAPLGLVTGVVVDARGAPVPRAHVALYRRADPDGEFALFGLPLDRARHPSATGRTDRKGRFELVCPDPGPLILRAERSGEVPAELTGLDLDPERGARDLRVAFGAGGAVAGELRLPDGSPGAGLWVCATRGDHAPRAERVDARGRFRFEDLMPGAWSFAVAAGPLPTRATSITEHGRGFTQVEAPHELAASCRVEPGGLAHVVLAPEGPELRELRGRLRVVGGPALRWTARRGEQGLPRALDDDGCFRLEATGEPGDVLLVGASENGTRLELRLDPQATLDVTLELGAIAGRAQALALTVRALVYEWQGDDGATARAHVSIDDAGRFRLDAAPAGAGRLVDPDDGRIVAEFEVLPHGTARIELP